MSMLKKWFPIASGFEIIYTQSDIRRFQRHYWISALVFIFFTITISFSAQQLLSWLLHLYAFFLLPAYIIPISPALPFITSLTIGFFSAAIMTWWIYKRSMKDRFFRFLSFHNQRLGFDQSKAVKAFFYMDHF